MSEFSGELTGARLTLDEYLDDFYSRIGKTHEGDCWKIERQQTFIESDNESWEASHRGDWARALELLEERRPRFGRITRKR